MRVILAILLSTMAITMAIVVVTTYGGNPEVQPTAQDASAPFSIPVSPSLQSTGMQPTRLPDATEINPTSEPSGEFEIGEVEVSSNMEYYGSTTIEEVILHSDIVAVASLQSAKPSTLQGSWDKEYTAVLTFRFKIVKYLKGNGPETVNIDVVRCCGRSLWHKSKESAIEDAKNWDSNRDKTWDNRSALVFLYKASEGRRQIADNPEHYEFTAPFSYGYAHRVFLDSGENRAWLPSQARSTVASGQSVTDEMLFLTEVPVGVEGSVGRSESTVSVGKVRSIIDEQNLATSSNTAVTDYKRCIAQVLSWKRQKQAYAQNDDFPFDRGPIGLTITSGAPRHSNLDEGSVYGDVSKGYDEHRLTGTDAGLFETWIDDPDENAANGWRQGSRTTRPLPAGIYNVQFNTRDYSCTGSDYWDEDNNVAWVITVTAASDVIHEAFFDPGATASGEAGYDHLDIGEFSPDTFTMPNSTDKIGVDRLTWFEGVIEMQLTPHTNLSSYEMDIIELDGSVSLTIPFSRATVRGDGGSRSYTWEQCDQPWHDDDLLMIRIREAGASGLGTYPRACRSSSRPAPPGIATATSTLSPTPTATPAKRSKYPKLEPFLHDLTDEYESMAGNGVSENISTNCAEIQCVGVAVHTYDDQSAIKRFIRENKIEANYSYGETVLHAYPPILLLGPLSQQNGVRFVTQQFQISVPGSRPWLDPRHDPFRSKEAQGPDISGDATTANPMPTVTPRPVFGGESATVTLTTTPTLGSAVQKYPKLAPIFQEWLDKFDPHFPPGRTYAEIVTTGEFSRIVKLLDEDGYEHVIEGNSIFVFEVPILTLADWSNCTEVVSVLFNEWSSRSLGLDTQISEIHESGDAFAQEE